MHCITFFHSWLSLFSFITTLTICTSYFKQKYRLINAKQPDIFNCYGVAQINNRLDCLFRETEKRLLEVVTYLDLISNKPGMYPSVYIIILSTV